MPGVRGGGPVNEEIVVRRAAWRSLLLHAREVARTKGVETIGWLLGFFAGPEVWVLDVAHATRFKSRSRYGAAADPTEEAELASKYPRNVGIVGLYHSHPFRDESDHAIFHSRTDDRTLQSRASRHENYLSVVTDGRDAEVFLRGRQEDRVKPRLADSASYRERLSAIRVPVSPRWSFTVRAEPGELRGTVDRRISQELQVAMKETALEGDVLRVPRLRGGAEKNAFSLVRADGGWRVHVQFRMEPVVYVAPEDRDDVGDVARNEILDDFVHLMWLGWSPNGLAGREARSIEVNLGGLRVHDSPPLPRKVYSPPRRVSVLKHGP